MFDFTSTGNKSLLYSPCAAIINSRQAAFPVGSNPWVKNSLRAVEHIAGREKTIVTSIGMNTWELVLACASRIGIPVIVIIPDKYSTNEQLIDKLVDEFKLSPENLCLLFPETDFRAKQDRMHWRDNVVCDIADSVIPVSIRPKGHFDTFLQTTDKQIFSRYHVPFSKSARPRPNYNNISFSSELNDDWVIHFTRSNKYSRPGQSKFDYYREIINSDAEYCNSAFNNLMSILRLKKIFASGKYIRSDKPVVGFTLYNSDFAGNLFRYRPRMINPYFEPFGIALQKEYAREIGLKPVIYGNIDNYKSLANTEKPLFQAEGIKGQWISDHEWRHIGDLDLNGLDSKSVRVVVPRNLDRLRLHDATPFQITTISIE
ncbi:MAG: hypothetical protein KAR42_00865 [candidate division Zixibacteria bacterium]|nr:hypothetical protein [candidate division Zixibacteria bacterium]